MMSRRRSFFTFGALLAAVVLLAPATALAQPTAVAIAKADPPAFDKLLVTWGADPTAATEGYRIFYRKQADETGAADPTAANNSGYMDVSGRTTVKVTLTGLAHNSYYRAAVAPIDGDDLVGALVGLADTAASGNAKTELANRPAPPRNVTATGGDGTFTVMWEAPYAGEAGLTIKEYRVQKREVAGGLFGDWIPTSAKGSDYAGGMKVAGDKTMVTFEGLKNGTTYQARVRATSSADVVGDYTIPDGDTSTPGAEAATVGDDDMDDDDGDDMMLAAPKITEVMAGDGQITVKWGMVEGATKYEARAVAGGNTMLMSTEEMSATFMNLNNGMEYMVSDRAGNADGYGEWSEAMAATPMMPTPALPLFGALALGAGLVAAGRARLRRRRALQAARVRGQLGR